MAIGLVPETPPPNQAPKKNVLTRLKERLSSKQQPQEEKKVAFSTHYSELFTGQQTGQEISARGVVEKQRSEKATRIELSEPLRDTYADYLGTYVASLGRVAQRGREILESSAHAVDLRLLDQLTTKGKPDTTKIKTFLQTPENWELATMIIGKQTALSLFAEGLQALKIPVGARQNQPADQLLVRIGWDQGRINRFYQDQIARRFLPQHLARTQTAIGGGIGVTGLGAVIGRILGGGGGAAGGAGVGALAAYGGGKLIQSLTTDGVRFNMTQAADALTYMQTQPRNLQEAEFMMEMTGIDIRDYRVVGNTIQYRVANPNTSRVTTGEAASLRDEDAIRNVSILQDQVLKGLIARLEFYKECGVPDQLLDALPEQFLLTGGQPEKTGLLMDQDVWTAFQATGGVGPNVVDNITRYQQARLAVMMDYLRKSVDNAQFNEAPDTRIVSSITEKRSRRIGEGATVAQRKKEVQDRIDSFNADKTALGGERTTFDGYEQKLKELQELEQEFRVSFPNISDADPETAIRRRLDPKANPRDFISQERRLLWENAITNLEGELTQLNQLVTTLQAQPAAQRGTDRLAVALERQEAKSTALKTARENFLDEAERIRDDQLKQLQGTPESEGFLTRLNAKKSAIGQNSETLRGITNQDRTITEDFALLRSWGVTNTELRTLTIDQLLERVNQINRTNVNQGWATSENTRAFNRNRLLHAIVEARANVFVSYDPLRPYRQSAVNMLNGLGVTSDRLRTLSVNEIHALMNKRFVTSGGTSGWPDLQNDVNGPIIEAAVQEVTRDTLADRARARIRVYNELTRTLDQNIAAEQNRLENIDLTREVDMLGITLDLTNRQGEILSSTDQIINGGNRDKFTDVTRIDPVDTTLLPAERENYGGAPLPRGYLEIMDLMLDYRARADNNEYFQKIFRVLPPEKLIATLMGSPNLGLREVATITDFDSFFNELRARTRDGRIDRVSLALGFKDVINHLVREANAMP